MSSKTGKAALIEQLLADGVCYMFGNPGTVEEGILDELSQHPELRYILALQEAVAVGIADGYARASGKVGVVQLHSGVGLGNGIGMLYQAWKGHTPLVVLSGIAGVRYEALDAHMAADLVGMARPVTKWAEVARDPSSLLRLLRRAVKIALTPPMGPVFLALPMDVLDAPNMEAVTPTSVPLTRCAPDMDLLSQAAALLASAQRPQIIMGDGIAASGAQAELARVAELLGAEVWGADSFEVNMSYTHPLFRDLLGHMFGEHSRALVAQADAVLICGTFVFPEVFPALSTVFAAEARVIHIDLDCDAIAKNFPVTLGLLGDPKLTLGKLAALLQAEQSSEQQAAATARAALIGAEKERSEAEAREADRVRSGLVPLHASQFMEMLASKLPADALVFDEALTCSTDLVRYLPPTRPGHYFLTHSTALGVGFPGALGLKLAHPERVVFGFSGDGGSMYTIPALWTAAHERIGVKFVVCNNHSYKLLKHNIQAYWQEQHLAEHAFPASFDVNQPDLRFDLLAESMGVRAVRVETPEQIEPAIQQALADDQPFLIELLLSSEVPEHIMQQALHAYSIA
ncbi:MAG TPA: thiamine pyrophosphate-binding protein [Ktedonobacteraceae bacterium]